jgi:hypothetical protein
MWNMYETLKLNSCNYRGGILHKIMQFEYLK